VHDLAPGTRIAEAYAIEERISAAGKSYRGRRLAEAARAP
jgi:hypothetical protein